MALAQEGGCDHGHELGLTPRAVAPAPTGVNHRGQQRGQAPGPEDLAGEARHLQAAHRMHIAEQVEQIRSSDDILAQVGLIAGFVADEEGLLAWADDVQPGGLAPGPERLAEPGTLVQQ